jgi:hypothetical protein
MKLVATTITAVTLALAVTPVAAKRVAPDRTMLILGDLAVAAKCDDPKSLQRPWCIAATGWAGGTAAKLPVGKVLLGFTVERKASATGAWDLNGDPSIHLVALAVRRDGAALELRLTAITPSNDEEKTMMAEAIIGLAGVFKKGGAAKVPKDLATYARSLGKKSGFFATKGTKGWTWSGGNDMPTGELRKVGKYWVAIETPTTGEDGRFITILTDKWK